MHSTQAPGLPLGYEQTLQGTEAQKDHTRQRCPNLHPKPALTKFAALQGCTEHPYTLCCSKVARSKHVSEQFCGGQVSIHGSKGNASPQEKEHKGHKVKGPDLHQGLL